MFCVDHGLYLEVMPNGNKYWRVRFRRDGKEEKVTLGEYDSAAVKDITLDQCGSGAMLGLSNARELCTILKKGVAHGSTPKNVLNPPGSMTFRQVATAWFTTKFKETLTISEVINDIEEIDVRKISDGHARTTLYRIRAYLLQPLGSRPIKKIDSKELFDTLMSIKSRRSGTHGKQENGTHSYVEAMRKTRQIAGQIFKHGVFLRECEHNIARDLEGVLPTSKPRHYAALTMEKDIKDLMVRMECYHGTQVVRLALEFSLRTFQRPGEIRHMEWNEIDLDSKTWTIPKEKTKKKQSPHIVPLANQVVTLLKNLKPLTGRGKYVFPSERTLNGSRPMSENTVRVALRTMGYTNEDMCAHGFRTLASTNLYGQGWPSDVIERQLDHAERNKVKAAYNQAEYLPERRKMIQHWADWLDNLKETQ